MKKNIKLISITLTLIVSTILGFVSIEILKDYGWTIFLVIPFLIGFLPPYIVGRYVGSIIGYVGFEYLDS